MRRERLWRGLAAGAGLAAVVGAGLRRRRVLRRARTYADRVCEDAEVVGGSYDPAEVTDLPAPVRRYFEAVLEPGQRHVRTAELAQSGTIRLGGAGSEWHPFGATQVYSVAPPGYAWSARVALLPLVSARVLDAYANGEGVLRADLGGIVPVARAGPDPRTNEAQLQRYLAETPWFPTALLPAAGVEWEGVDDRTARATLTDGDTAAAVTFHFEGDRVRRVTADRYRQETGDEGVWVGEYDSYEERDGLTIPTEAEVAWGTDEGRVPYWRGQVVDADYRY
jgi:hypothetical protein